MCGPFPSLNTWQAKKTSGYYYTCIQSEITGLLYNRGSRVKYGVDMNDVYTFEGQTEHRFMHAHTCTKYAKLVNISTTYIPAWYYLWSEGTVCV